MDSESFKGLYECLKRLKPKGVLGDYRGFQETPRKIQDTSGESRVVSRGFKRASGGFQGVLMEYYWKSEYFGGLHKDAFFKPSWNFPGNIDVF